jgi:peptidyl-prolyl cis-trans isomerase B (cyclophilin B)
MKQLFLVCSLSFSALALSAQTTKPSPTVVERLVEIKTPFGTMVAKLYNSTPLHRDNFIAKVKSNFYDSLLFHRIIEGFMIQGGDPMSKHADSGMVLGAGDAPGGMVPAEFRNKNFHKKGALAMARTDNPERASSNCQFYIVDGKTYDTATLNQLECNVRNNNPNFIYSPAQRAAYHTTGGTPFLDQNYTVFGEVVKGLEVIDKIAQQSKDDNDRPFKNIWMKIRMLN